MFDGVLLQIHLIHDLLLLKSENDYLDKLIWCQKQNKLLSALLSLMEPLPNFLCKHRGKFQKMKTIPT